MPDKDFLQWLSKHGEKEWGYVIYRTIYDDDEKWQRFLDALQAFIEHESDDEVVEMLNWIVMDDKEAFDGASVDAIRKHFRSWIEEQGMCEGDGTRYEACILADAASVDSVLALALPGEPDHNFLDNSGYGARRLKRDAEQVSTTSFVTAQKLPVE